MTLTTMLKFKIILTLALTINLTLTLTLTMTLTLTLTLLRPSGAKANEASGGEGSRAQASGSRREGVCPS